MPKGKRWPQETRVAVVDAFRAGTPMADVVKLYGVPSRTAYTWAIDAGVSVPESRAKQSSNARASENTVPAKQLPAGIRADLKGAVEKTTKRLNSGSIAGKEFDALTRGLKTILSMTPDLLTYEEKLNPEKADEPQQRRKTVLRLAGERGLGSRHNRVPGEPDGADSESTG